MKKSFMITIIALIALTALMAMATNVQAADVSIADELETALAGAEETVKLVEDITVDETITISNQKTLDLNGKTLTLNKSLVVSGGDLTVTGNGKIVTEVADPLISVEGKSTLTLENGTFKANTVDGAAIKVVGTTTDEGTTTKVKIGANAKVSANYAVYIPAKGGYGIVIDIYGTLEAISGNNGYNKGSIAMYINGKMQATTGNVPVINIYDGAKLTATEGVSGNANDDDAPAIYAAGYGIWNIKGGNITGSEALSIKAGKFNITGGTFTANGKYINPAIAYGNGTEATGSAISMTSNSGYKGNVEISIANATVTSQNGYAISEATTKGTGVVLKSMKISSGDFSGKEGAVLVQNADKIEKFISGGTFSSDVEEYTIDTLTSVNDNGVFYVGTLNEITVSETANGTVKASLEKAVKGQTVELTISPETNYEVETIKVCDAQGNELKVVDNKFTMPDSKVVVEVTFKEKVEETPATEIQKEEKDETPKTGSLNIAIYVLIAIVAISSIGIVATKKTSKHSK